MQAPRSLSESYSPEKSTALDWIRNGYAFPGKPLPSPHLPPPKPTPGPITVPPSPDNPPRKPGESSGR